MERVYSHRVYYVFLGTGAAKREALPALGQMDIKFRLELYKGTTAYSNVALLSACFLPPACYLGYSISAIRSPTVRV